MDKSYSTDLQVAEDLENLVNIINKSIESAERTLKKAQEIDEVKELIAEIHSSREALLKVEESIKQIEATANILLTQSQSIQVNLEETIAKSSQNVDYIQKFLQEINSIGGLEKIGILLQEMQNTRLNLKQSEQQLLNTQENLVAIKGLEDYLNNFQSIRNRRQLWQFLTRELGFLGVIVYLLSLITPSRKK
ncbi:MULTISPECIES: hypothetical protein [unclassified Anabaena]|uniref:hypothetical protein n=1 Tax=unclassified Anabaena TaxID=2619674 RepID=UPI00082D2C6B|nr:MULTISPECIES: hypothetical protein [unclassified Anabaena]